MAQPILRSIGGRLHPVGKLTVANYMMNPNMELATAGDIDFWTKVNCTFQRNSFHQFGQYSGKVTYTSTTSLPVLTQSVTVRQLQTYIMSVSMSIPSTLSAGVSLFADIFDPNGAYIVTLGGPFISTIGTGAGWIRPSMLFDIPVGGAQANFYFTATTQPTSLDTYYLDGIRLQTGTDAGPYVDGSMSGYVWAGTPNQSFTLQSEFPSAFRAFKTSPLRGGWDARGSMYAHDYAPLVS